jgi:hypothetical protein
MVDLSDLIEIGVKDGFNTLVICKSFTRRK